MGEVRFGPLPLLVHELTGLRYSLFIALYPVGISSEWWLMYNATTVTEHWAVFGIFYFFLGLYVPGEYRVGYLFKAFKLTDSRLGDDVLVHVEAKTEGYGSSMSQRTQRERTGKGIEFWKFTLLDLKMNPEE